MDDATKLLQDFLDKENLQINQGDFIVKQVSDGSLIISKPIVTVNKKQNAPAPTQETVEGEPVSNGS